jgi:hypothetical protein
MRAVILALGLVLTACSGTADQNAASPGASGSTAGTTSLAMPLAAADLGALRAAEAKLRADMREKAGLARLGAAGAELATFMDRTASFLLVQAPRAAGLKARASSGGRVAAPLVGLPSPGDTLIGTYAMTTVLFAGLIGDRPTTLAGTQDPNEKCPCTKSVNLDPTKDEVTVDGNKGTITTTMTATVMVSGSRVSVDLKMRIEGEVRDAKTGAVLFKIASESTGHADGDACPDATGVANASMSFTGSDDHFDGAGAKTGSSATSFGGQIRMRVDDSAKLAGVEVTASGQTGVFGAELIRQAALTAAPAFEKGWRSGMCIEVIVDPKSGDVEPDSETTVTAKVKHKIEGNELDKPVEAKLSSGVKSIDPSGSKVKSPATFKYKAGAESGDKGSVSFDSVSNRGIGHASVTYAVAGGWVISSNGTSDENFQGVVSNTLNVSIKDLKIKAEKGGALNGSGTMFLSGVVTSGAGICIGQLDQQLPITATGTVVGTGATAMLRLTLNTPAPAGVQVFMVCTVPGGGTYSQFIGAEGHSDRYGEAMGAFELPADGGTANINRTAAIGGLMNVAATGRFTVVKAKK